MLLPRLIQFYKNINRKPGNNPRFFCYLCIVDFTSVLPRMCRPYASGVSFWGFTEICNRLQGGLRNRFTHGLSYFLLWGFRFRNDTNTIRPWWPQTRPYRAFDVPAAQCTTRPDKRRYTRNLPKLTFDIKKYCKLFWYLNKVLYICIRK